METQLKPWEVVGDDQVMASGYGKWLKKRNYRNPETSEVLDFVLYGQRDWSVILAITEDNQVLVVREFKQGRDAIDDELPAGTGEFAEESPVQVIERELLEETGYRAESVHELASQWMATRGSTTRFHPFLGLGCRRVQAAKLDENEQIESRLVSVDQWIKMVVRGDITEPSAVVTTMQSLPHLLRRGVITGAQLAFWLSSA